MSNWGPDRNLSLDEGKYHVVIVPANHRAEFHFSCHAWYENAAIIYAHDPTDPQVFAERGNYSRSLLDWHAPIVPHEAHYMITGWHKPSPPNHRNPWVQSPRLVLQDSPRYVEVGFEDGSDFDYNDMLVTITIRPA